MTNPNDIAAAHPSVTLAGLVAIHSTGPGMPRAVAVAPAVGDGDAAVHQTRQITARRHAGRMPPRAGVPRRAIDGGSRGATALLTEAL